MTMPTSRRAILAGAASLPALALPAMAIAAPAVGECSFPGLAERLIAIRVRWVAQCKAGEVHSNLIDDKMMELTGRPRDWHPKYDEPDFEEYHSALKQAHKAVPDHNPVDESGSSIAWNEIHDELFAVCEEIVEQHAQSAADLGVHAQAYALMRSEYWTGETDDERIRPIIDSVCKFCGVEPLPGVEIVPLNDDSDEDDDGKADAVAEREPQKPDPVIAAINAHSEAYERHGAACKAYGEAQQAMFDDANATAAEKRRVRDAEECEGRACHSAMAAWRALLNFKVSRDIDANSAMSRAYLFAYIRGHVERENGMFLGRDDLLTFLGAVQDAVTPPWVERVMEVQAAKEA